MQNHVILNILLIILLDLKSAVSGHILASWFDLVVVGEVGRSSSCVNALRLYQTSPILGVPYSCTKSVCSTRTSYNDWRNCIIIIVVFVSGVTCGIVLLFTCWCFDRGWPGW